jgi:hypothetical protein
MSSNASDNNSATNLFNCNFGPGDRTAAKGADLALGKLDDAVAGGVDGVIAAHLGTVAGPLGHADLPDYDLAGLDLFAAEKLNPEALARAVVDVFGGTAGFDMTH